MLKLNQLSKEVFDASNVNNVAVKVNNTEISRKDIVATGRLVACEYVGQLINKAKIGESYETRLNGIEYADLAKKHLEKKMLFCAAQANKLSGKEAPATFEEVKRNGAYAKDAMFLRVMAEIDRDVLDPIFFAVIDSVGMGLMQLEGAQLGATTQIDIRSNDVFLFEDSACGSGRSTTKNYLYAKTVTITPTVYACNATLKWYQDVVNGDAGRYYAAIINGMYNKIYAKLMKVLKNATTGNAYIPAGLTANTYTTANLITLTDLVAAANGVRVGDLMAIGNRMALSALLPVDGLGGAITGLQYGLGEEWFKNGFLAKAAGIDLFPVSPVIVPTTQNSTLDTIDTGTSIYFVPKAGYGYAPIRGVYAEGSPITLTATPSETADFTIDINVGAMFEIAPLFASKVGVMTNVYSVG